MHSKLLIQVKQISRVIYYKKVEFIKKIKTQKWAARLKINEIYTTGNEIETIKDIHYLIYILI